MLQNREGQRVPNVTFPVREGNTWKKLTSDDIFKNKTVVVFSLPGAFTPTCSSTHLPRYNELAPAFFKEGVDSIVCVSVNDTFVMNEWARTRNRPTSRCCPTATALHRRHGHAGRQERPVSASAAGATPCWSRTAWCRRCSSSRKRKAIPLKCRTPTPCWRTSRPRPSPTRWSCSPSRAARSAWKPGAAAGQGFRSDRDPAGEQGPRPRHRRRLGQGHRAAGVHQRLADRRPGRPEGALRLTGIRHAGPGRPGMPRGSAPCVEPARRIPRCARSCAAPSGRRGDGRVPSPRSKANSP